MRYDEVINVVQQASGTGFDEAERAAQAVLQTLAERIPEGEARDLAARLPAELAPWIATKGPAEGFDVDEFVRRIAEREGVDPATAERHARAVFAALGRVIDDEELADLRAVLPRDFLALLPRGPQVEIVSAPALLQRVSERTGLDADRAAKATAAVLETLAERIAGGEVEDLEERLPQPFHEPLERGRQRSGGKATRMSLDEFVRRVAEREGTGAEEARDHVRAVLATLREALGTEFFDVTVQLPREYVDELARR